MNRKTVFVIGDSVSIHYGPYLKKMINSKYDYSRKGDIDAALKDLNKPVGANAGDSNMVLEYLISEHESDVKYDILLLNCGLHDIRVDRDTKKIQTEALKYRENLNQIADLALKMSVQVLWITSTPVIDEIHNSREGGFLRYNKDVLLYNSIAETVMFNHKIPCIDLYTFTKNLGENIYHDHVHFKEDIRAVQAAFISGYLFRDKYSFRIDGELVYIKQPGFGELDYVEELWSDEETMKDVGGKVSFPIDGRKLWYEKMVSPTDGKNFYCLIYNHDDVPVGEVSFHRFDIEDKKADFNIKVQHKYRNKGYGKEAMKLLLSYYFYDFGGQVIFDDVINEKGQKALQSFGFETVSKCGNEISFKMTKERFITLQCTRN